MTLTKKDQEQYHRLAAIEEQPSGESSPGESHKGADAAAIGHKLLLEALGSEEAVTKATGGRPNLGNERAGGGESPTIRFRVTPKQREGVTALVQQMKFSNDSELVRVALDEYLSKNLQASV